MKENIYEKKSVHSLILYFSIPAIFSLIVEIMASVVDTIFAGHLGEISVDALTTMGLLSPILSIYTAIQALFAVSTSIMIAKYLKNQTTRTEYFITGIGMTFVTSIIISIVSYFIMPQLLSFIGATGQILTLSEKYLKIQLFSNIFSALGYTLTSCIRAVGFPRVEMVLTGGAVLVNVVFNSIFVFCFNMGFIGLAYGTLISEIFCFLLSVLWLFKHQFIKGECRLSYKKLVKYTTELLKLGIAQTIIQALAGCTAYFVNQSLMVHTTLNHVAVWNVVQKIYTLLLMPVVGITQGVQTIIAYFDGHQEDNKKKKALITTICYTVLYGVIGIVFIFIYGKTILSFFIGSSAIFQLGNSILRIVFSTFPLMGIFYTIITLYEVTGHEGKAVFLILTRQVFLMIPLVYLLPQIFHRFSFAIFFAVPVADIIALLMAIVSGKKRTK
nr:MATE family efflux transporter [uncultured Sellimonas sp.]